MYAYIDLCSEWISKPTLQRYPKLKGEEKHRKYTSSIVDTKSSLDKALSEIQVDNE